MVSGKVLFILWTIWFMGSFIFLLFNKESYIGWLVWVLSLGALFGYVVLTGEIM